MRAAAALGAGRFALAFSLQPLVVLFGFLAFVGFVAHTFFLFCLRRVVCLRCELRERHFALVAALFLCALNWIYLVWRGV